MNMERKAGPAHNNEKIDQSQATMELNAFKQEVTTTGGGEEEMSFLTRLIIDVKHGNKTPLEAITEGRKFMATRQQGSL